jgi:GT2 family glycosyltransferase
LNRVAIILLNWNSYEHTANCINSLSLCVSESFDIVVVDNGSQDGSLQKLQKQFPLVFFLPQDKNLGFAGGNNRGFEFVLTRSYEYVMMLNNDVFVEPEFLFHLVNFMDFHQEVAAVQPKIFFNRDRSIVWNGGSRYASFFGWTYSSNYMQKQGSVQKKIHEVDWITGCAMFMRTSVLKEVGFLNEDFFFFYEDVDLSFRMKEAGYKLIFHPDSIVYHIVGASHTAQTKGPEGYANPVVHYMNIRNHFWLLRTWTKWYEWPTAIIVYLVYIISFMIYFIIRFRWKKLCAVCQGIYDGFFKNYTSLR